MFIVIGIVGRDERAREKLALPGFVLITDLPDNAWYGRYRPGGFARNTPTNPVHA